VLGVDDGWELPTLESDVSRKATIDNLFVQRSEQLAPGKSAATSSERVRTGAISAMGASLKQMAESAKVASRLQDQIVAGAVVVELDPEKIDASLISDRIAADVDPSFDELVESIRASGQQVPVLVRPLESGRYQIAYGRRRLRAAAKLGIRVKALVKEMADAELVIAQGKENLDRKDLSYIERAQFARRLEDQGFDRVVIMAALSTDKADLSRYISVARAIPERIIDAIGPAPKAGRLRWVALAEKLAKAPTAVDAVIAGPEFQRLESDARFGAVFNAFSQTVASAIIWACDKAARIEHKSDRVVLTIDETRKPNFGAYVVGRLDEIYREFCERKEADEGH
jgi:ParB family chromosome partitioning protein